MMNSSSGKPVRKVIQQFFNQEIDGQQLLRVFMAYEQWHIPADFDSEGRLGFALSRYSEGDRWFQAFTDRDAVEAYEAAYGKGSLGEYFITTAGWSAFAQIDETLDGVNINPYTPLALHYRQPQIPLLKNWAKTVEVETAIAAPDKFSDPFGVMKHFAGYRIALFDSGGNVQIALAPDSQGRKLAAIFTAEDTLNAFLVYLKAAVPHRYADVRTLLLDGSELFSRLRALPLDGIVFNPKGAIPPRAFGSALIRHILDAR